MSGPAIHDIIAREYLNKVLKTKYTDPQSASFWSEMDTGKLSPFYRLGAQGPDFLFFNMNDWPGGIKTLAQIYWEVTDFIEEFKETLKSIIPQEIWDAIAVIEGLAEDAAERSVLLTELGETIKDVQKNIDALKSLVIAAGEKYITGAVDLYSVLSHPQQHGQKYPDWWWFDVLHIRRSGQFTGELLKRSKDFSPERAYALGYLTHYAADTVGHPYVNGISGGPYRTHSQRHKVAENYQDVWAYSNYAGGEFIKSNLAEKYIILGDEKSLPGDLKKFLVSCINKVYYESGQPLYGKEIKEDDLDVAYRTWLMWFTKSTNDDDLPTPKPYSLTAEIVQAWEQFTNNVGDIADYVGDSLPSEFSLLALLEFLFALIVGPILLALSVLDFVAGMILTIGTAPLRFFLNLTYELLYNAYQNFRYGVALNGFAFPYQSQLANPLTLHLLKTNIPDQFGHHANSLVNGNAYPSIKFKMTGLENESHLMYPWPVGSNLEKDGTVGFPTPYFGKDPSWYMTDPKNTFVPGWYDGFKNFVEATGPEPGEGEILDRFQSLKVIASRGGLGNAVSFSDKLYGEFLTFGKKTKFADFCLDSDRGYGFLSWRKVKDSSLINKPINDYQQTNVEIEKSKTVLNTQTDIIPPAGGVL